VSDDPLIGASLGGYLVLGRLGQGGMGAVYRAEAEDGGLVALKVIATGFAADPGARERFAKEVRLQRGLVHPRVVAGRSDLGREGDRLFFALELVAGEDLAGVLRREGRLAPERAASVAADVLEALAHAHARGVLHRDVKPSNVFLDDAGRAKLGDFGLAFAAGETRLTRTGTTLGTPEYMAPEQGEGREPDARSDVYATGVLLYEALAGHPPFRAPSPLAVLRQHSERPPPPLPERVPAALAAVAERALAKAPGDRFPSAAAMREAVVAAAADSGDDDVRRAQATAETVELARSTAARAPRRRVEAAARSTVALPAPPQPPARRLAIGAALAAGAALAVALGGLLLARDAPTPPSRATPAPSAESPAPSPDSPGPSSASPSAESPAPSPDSPRPEPPDDQDPDWVRVTLRDGETFTARLVAMDVAAGTLRTRDADGAERETPLGEVATYAKASPPAPDPSGAGRVRVTLDDGTTFEAELVELDVVAGVLVTRGPDGSVRRDPLDRVRTYTKLGR